MLRFDFTLGTTQMAITLSVADLLRIKLIDNYIKNNYEQLF